MHRESSFGKSKQDQPRGIRCGNRGAGTVPAFRGAQGTGRVREGLGEMQHGPGKCQESEQRHCKQEYAANSSTLPDT